MSADTIAEANKSLGAPVPTKGKPGPKPGSKPTKAAKTPVKGKSAPLSAGLSDTQRGKAATAARAAILKAMGQKPVVEMDGPMPAISSGSSCIDDLIGGTLAMNGAGPKCLGYPRRFITEIFGQESSGKTTAALEAIAECQRNGGLAMFLDFEHALDHGYAKKLGVKFTDDQLLLYQPNTMEEGWRMMYLGLQAGVDLIVVDSVAAMVPEAELNKKPGEAPKIGVVASAMAQMLPKFGVWLHKPEHSKNPLGTAIVLLNQTRAKISTGGYGGGGGGDDSDNTSGGKALKFYCYLRLKFSKVRSEFIKRKDKFTGKEKNTPFGNHTSVKIIKSKVDGKQGYTSDIFIRFNHGIDDYYSMIEAGVTQKVIKKEGTWYNFDGKRFQGREALRKALIDDADYFLALRAKVLAAVRDEVSDEDLEEGEVTTAAPGEESDPEVEELDLSGMDESLDLTGGDDSDDDEGDSDESEED